MGLPDNSGLIVGVNTINYDASSSVRNKAKVNKWIKIDFVVCFFFAKFGILFPKFVLTYCEKKKMF